LVELEGLFDFHGSAGWGDVYVGFGDAGPALFVDVADNLGGAADDAEAASVAGGELEPVEEYGGVLAVNAAGGERVDDAGDGELDGLAIFHGGKFEEERVLHLGGLEVDLVAVEVVTAVEAVVEVAED
jgi:hypothetical protein